MLALVQEMANVDNNPPIDDVQLPPQFAANAAVQDTVQLKMLRLLREIAQDRHTGQGSQGGRGGQGGWDGRVGREGSRNRNHRTPDNANNSRRLIKVYCRTHGGYNHLSRDCTRKAQGHRDEAAMTDQMSGSNTFCQPVQEWREETEHQLSTIDKINMTFTKDNRINSSSSIVSPSNSKIENVNLSSKLNEIEEIVFAKGDSAASHHYWREKDKQVLRDILDSPGPSVLLPSGKKDRHQDFFLPLSKKLSPTASTAMILPGFKSASLISISQLCDDNCNVYLNKQILIAVKEGEIIIEGKRNKTDGLWDIPVQKASISALNHPIPLIHPGMYPSRTRINKSNIILPMAPTKCKHRVNKVLRHFDDLINDNIFDNLLKKQHKMYTKQFCQLKYNMTILQCRS